MNLNRVVLLEWNWMIKEIHVDQLLWNDVFETIRPKSNE